jgi:hypothetical protein
MSAPDQAMTPRFTRSQLLAALLLLLLLWAVLAARLLIAT